MNKSGYARGMVLSLAANLLGMAAALVTVTGAARLLGKSAVGIFSIILVLIQLASVLGDIGVRSTAIHSLSGSDSRERDRTAHYFLTCSLIASLLVCVGVAVSMPWLQRLWPYPEFHRYGWLAIPAAFFTINFQMTTSLLVAVGKFRALSLVSGGVEVLRGALSIACLFAGFGIEGLLWCLIATRALGVAVVAVTIPSQFGLTLSHPRRAEFARFGGWLYGCSVVSVITTRTADALLTSLMGPSAVAMYTTAMQLPSTLQRSFESIRPVMLGYASSQASAGPAQLLIEVRLMSGLLAIAAAALIALADPLVTLLYSQQYAGAVNIMRVLCVWVAISVVNYYLAIALIGRGRAREVFFITLPQLAAMLLATVLLVPRFSGLGAAAALLLTAVLGSTLSFRLLAGADRALAGRFAAVLLRSFVPVGAMCLYVVEVSDSWPVLAVLSVGSAVAVFVSKVLVPSELKGFGVALTRGGSLRSATNRAVP